MSFPGELSGQSNREVSLGTGLYEGLQILFCPSDGWEAAGFHSYDDSRTVGFQGYVYPPVKTHINTNISCLKVKVLASRF